jgi:hypothetical protein
LIFIVVNVIVNIHIFGQKRYTTRISRGLEWRLCLVVGREGQGFVRTVGARGVATVAVAVLVSVVFRRVALAVLLVSMVPDVLLLFWVRCPVRPSPVCSR